MSTSNRFPRFPRTSMRRRYVRHAASVAVAATLMAACSSSADEVPSTTLDGSGATTVNPEAEAPQVGLEPGSNLPPDVNSTDQSNDSSTGDGDMGPGTSESEATGG